MQVFFDCVIDIHVHVEDEHVFKREESRAKQGRKCELEVGEDCACVWHHQKTPIEQQTRSSPGGSELLRREFTASAATRFVDLHARSL